MWYRYRVQFHDHKPQYVNATDPAMAELKAIRQIRFRQKSRSLTVRSVTELHPLYLHRTRQ